MSMKNNRLFPLFLGMVLLFSNCEQPTDQILSPVIENPDNPNSGDQITENSDDPNGDDPVIEDTALAEISVTSIKTSYLMGETIDTDGLTVKNIYTDGSSEITNDYILEGSTFTAGSALITITSKTDASKTASFTIDVSNQLIYTGLPVLYIETQNAQPIISKETYINMNLNIVSDNPGHCLEKTGFKDGIRGRGNSTWSYPKKPYRIKFDKKTSLFGLTAAKSWVLLANYKDATLLTGTIAFELGSRFELPFTNHYVHVDLVLNGNYQGSYVLTEQVQVGSGRVDIDEQADYLVELDVYYDDEPKFKTPNLQLPVMIKSPDFGSVLTQYDFVIDSLNEFDAVLSDEHFPDNNYTDILDIDSFVDFIMINEMVRNGELGHPKSTYLYKNSSDKIKMGPLWDFDWAFGIGGNTSVDVSTAESRYKRSGAGHKRQGTFRWPGAR